MPTFSWDEPEGCATSRGWCELLGDHPDDSPRFKVSRVCGYYLDYGPDSPSHGPGGESVLASAYLFRCKLVQSTTRLGVPWFFTVADAKAWVERAVAAHLEQLAVEAA